jgi:integrase
MPLTDLAVRNAKGGEKPRKMTDGGGLYLLVQPNGSRLWRMNYRWLGKQKTLSFGAYPATDLATARVERDKARTLLAREIDPSRAKVEMKAARLTAEETTFRLIGEEWRAMRNQTDIRAATKTKDRECLELHAYPHFGDRPITQIKPLEILEPLRRMEAKGHRVITRKVRATVSRVFDYAIATGRAEVNPAQPLASAMLPVQTKHHPGLTDPKKVGALMLAIDGYDGLPSVLLGLKFIAYTFVRTIEMRSACWDWVDWDEKLLCVPPGVMKKARAHLVPLSAQALAILRGAQALAVATGKSTGQDLIFPGVKGSRARMSENTINGALRRLGYSGDVHVGHGFRTTASTTLNESGRFKEDWIERQLAHVEDNKVRGAYNAAEYLPARRHMMQWYADWLDRQKAVAALM